jgi:hypothetical protein
MVVPLLESAAVESAVERVLVDALSNVWLTVRSPRRGTGGAGLATATVTVLHGAPSPEEMRAIVDALRRARAPEGGDGARPAHVETACLLRLAPGRYAALYAAPGHAPDPRSPAELRAAVRDALKAAKVTAVTEVRYGSYDLEGYRAALLGAGALVVFTTSESQGAFYFEAWAADVPTFVFSGVGGFQHEWDGNIWLTEPAPYLSPLTGAYWSTPAQLANLFRPALQFQPRRWVMEHGSLEVVGAALVADVRARLQAKCQRESEPQPPQTP